MGESMGGMIAQEIAINYPQRVRKLVLVSTYARDDQSSSGSTSELFKEVQTTGKVGSSLINLAFNKPLNRVFVKVMARINSTFTKGSVKKVNKVGFDGQLEACLKHNTLDRLPLIKAPTLIIVGEADRVIKPSSSEIMAARIPLCQLAKFKNGSHVLNMEMTNLFNQTVLNFLTDSMISSD